MINLTEMRVGWRPSTATWTVWSTCTKPPKRLGTLEPYEQRTRTTTPNVYNTSSTATVLSHPVGDTKMESYIQNHNQKQKQKQSNHFYADGCFIKTKRDKSLTLINRRIPLILHQLKTHMHDNTVWTTSTPVVVPRFRTTVTTTSTSCYSFVGGVVVVVSKRYHRQSSISLMVILMMMMMMMDAAAQARHRDGIEVCTIPTTKKTSKQTERIMRCRWNIEERIFTSGYLNTKRNNNSSIGKVWWREQRIPIIRRMRRKRRRRKTKI